MRDLNRYLAIKHKISDRQLRLAEYVLKSSDLALQKSARALWTEYEISGESLIETLRTVDIEELENNQLSEQEARIECLEEQFERICRDFGDHGRKVVPIH